MMQRFLDDIDSPNVEVILDAVNLLDRNNYKEQEAVFDKAFKLYGDRVTVAHIKDFKIDENGDVAFEQVGEGLLNYKHLFKLLNSISHILQCLLKTLTKLVMQVIVNTYRRFMMKPKRGKVYETVV